MDVALLFTPGTIEADISLDGSDLKTERDLETAIIVSLFTDRRAKTDDPLDDPNDRRGWWGDTFANVAGDKIGSRLWLLSREKITELTLQRAREYANESLTWLVEDGIVKSYRVDTEVVGERANGILGIRVEVERQKNKITKYDYVWGQI